jgi:hypothetical protein
MVNFLMFSIYVVKKFALIQFEMNPPEHDMRDPGY